MKNSILPLYFIALVFSYSCAQQVDSKINDPKEISFSAELVLGDLQIPWGMAFLPDGSMLITEKSGQLIHFKDEKRTDIDNVPEVYNRGQGGLLDVKLHPEYETNGWLYITYSSSEGDDKGGNTALMRAKLKDNALVEKELLYKAIPNTTKGQHFGSRIEFDNEGFLYFSVGERGEMDIYPQDLAIDGGKIYRLHDDGSVPEDNPFVNKEDAIKAISSYGPRYPEGVVKHPETGEIWDHEHGPRGGDEINIIKKGANYGWPVITYGINYSGTPITDKTEMEGMEQPIYYWLPSIAPSGVTFVTSDFYPDWKGNLLVGSLAFQYLERLELESEKVVYREKLLADMGRVRDVRQAPDGYIYVAIEGKGIYKLVPKK